MILLLFIKVLANLKSWARKSVVQQNTSQDKLSHMRSRHYFASFSAFIILLSPITKCMALWKKASSGPNCLTSTNSLSLCARLYHCHSRLISSTADGSRTSLKAWWHTSGSGLTISNVNFLRLERTFWTVRKYRLWQKNGHAKLKIQAENMLKTRNVMKTTDKNGMVTSFAFDLVDDSIFTNIYWRCAKNRIRPWRNLYELQKSFTSCDKVTDDCDKSIFDHWNNWK